ncbi:hypothetical protein PIB30_117364 [Stylosanthes scabra]|uniref:Replication factor A C-terminal domain-containing protein n=1 Tax=Stylosanthes scabra TaxID=79078 RepID=A0ABU6Z391_9FABA|nr:hypothetical protein [Stylosanthes scabra]
MESHKITIHKLDYEERMAQARAVVVGNLHHDKVADVNASKLEWNLVVGIVRMYECPLPSNPSDFYQVDMILQDSEGDRIQCSIPKQTFCFFKTLLQEFGTYNMRDFIVQNPGRGVRTTSHRFKLSFYQKTSVQRLSTQTFPFSPIRITPFTGVVAMTEARQFHLIDCIGHVVGKEDVFDMVTRNGDASKRMAVYLQDIEGRKMKCTLFGSEMISQFHSFLQRDNVEPVVMVAQLFKPNFYLDETSIQSTFNSSQILFNPEYPEVMQFRERLLALGDLASQGIADVPTQSQNSVSMELSGGSINVETIESVLNMNEEKHCWVMGKMVSFDCEVKGWYYASCRNCYKKVDDSKNVYKCTTCGQIGSKPMLKYRLNVIITDGTGCITVLLWNSETTTVLGKTARDVKDSEPDLHPTSYAKVFDCLMERKILLKISIERKNISNVDPVYTVLKVSDDPAFIEMYSSQRSNIYEPEVSTSTGAASFGGVDADFYLGGSAVVSLSKVMHTLDVLFIYKNKIVIRVNNYS